MKDMRLGKWELFCLIFNSLIYKIFTQFSENYEKFGGSAAWLTSVFSGIVFLAVLWIILGFYEKYSDKGLLQAVQEKFGKRAVSAVAIIAVLYFAFGIIYASSSVYFVLKTVAYVKSPIWFILAFFAFGAIFICVCGSGAVRRLHSLCALGVGITLIAISLLSLRYAEVSNLTPILGKGIPSVFGKGLATLFMYSDILIIFFLPKPSDKFSFKKVTFISAVVAILVNIVVVTASNLNMPFELAEKLALPVYPLTKTANLGKFPVRLDSFYQTALISSSLLYISLALNIIIKNVAFVSKKSLKAVSALLCFCLCFGLCGCYDSKEVEEKAYIIALGVDEGTEEKFKYTFQISNPLESGGSIGAEEKSKEEGGKEEGNKTVDNIIVQALDYRIALEKLKSILSKEADMSHIKVIVYSIDVAKHHSLNHSQLLLNEREIRPGTSLCLAESASDFLLSVNPTLEESTVRYYELYFKNNQIPYAPMTELRDFVSRSVSSAYDAVIPITTDKGLWGMGIFDDGLLKETLSGDEVLIYKMLCGELKDINYSFENKSINISSYGKPDVKVDFNSQPKISIAVTLKTNNKAIEQKLREDAEAFLYKTASANCDILGIGKQVKVKALTQKDWNNMNWNNNYKNSSFYVKIFTKNVNYTENLQKD